MTPGARIQAAIEVIDRIAAGMAAEKALISWARGARFAGSGDRAAVRDHVFQALRCWRSHACLGGGETGRARMIGALRDDGSDPDEFFTGQGHAPSVLTDDERASGHAPSGNAALDMPDWLLEPLRASLGDRAEATARALRHRAPVMLRVNLRKADRRQVIDSLGREGINCVPHDIANTALIATEGARRLARSQAYLDGLFEFQDGSSQAAMADIDLMRTRTVLDYCAGGGGKSLALAARCDAAFFAHDSDPARMQDLPQRAERAGVKIALRATSELPDKPLFDMVLCDVPCSGSGTWRRTPDAKWRLTPERLEDLGRIQAQILADAAQLVAPGGQLIYATCSVLAQENEAQTAGFLKASPEWVRRKTHRFDVTDGGDGFFVEHLFRE